MAVGEDGEVGKGPLDGLALEGVGTLVKGTEGRVNNGAGAYETLKHHLTQRVTALREAEDVVMPRKHIQRYNKLSQKLLSLHFK